MRRHREGEAGSLLTEVSEDEWMHKSLDSREMKRSGIERVERRARAEDNLKISGGDALRGHTRSHPEHDG